MLVRFVSNPLRLGVLFNRALSSSPTASTSASNVSTNQVDDVLFADHGRKGLITLNRPKQLNALNQHIALKMNQKLKKWQHTKDLIVVKGTGGVYSAGGDVLNCFAHVHKRDFDALYEGYGAVSKVNGLLCYIKVPYLALINGIVMGAGVGMSIHGKYRVATETSLFAMPETQIGLFPDSGVSYFLSRMQNSLGPFLALTGYRLKGYDLYHAGIATHFCLSEYLPDLESGILMENSNVESVLKAFHAKSIQRLSNAKEPTFTLAENMNTIREVFSIDSVEDIITALQMRGDSFSQEVLRLLGLMAPLSLKVTLRQMKVTSQLDEFETLNQDYRLACKLFTANDFSEGVRALLVDKDMSPKWNPEKLSDITEERLAELFKPINPEDELNLPSAL